MFSSWIVYFAGSWHPDKNNRQEITANILSINRSVIALYQRVGDYFNSSLGLEQSSNFVPDPNSTGSIPCQDCESDSNSPGFLLFSKGRACLSNEDPKTSHKSHGAREDPRLACGPRIHRRRVVSIYHNSLIINKLHLLRQALG